MEALPPYWLRGWHAGNGHGGLSGPSRPDARQIRFSKSRGLKKHQAANVLGSQMKHNELRIWIMNAIEVNDNSSTRREFNAA